MNIADSEKSRIGEAHDPATLGVEDAYALYGEMQQHCPVHHSSAHGGFYTLTRYRDVRSAALDWQRLSSAGGVGLSSDRIVNGRIPAIEMDPPEHTIWRKLYMEAITPATLRAVESRIVDLANILIDGFAGSGGCDLVSDFTAQLPVLGVCELIGLTGRDPTIIQQLAHDFTASATDAAQRENVNERLGAFILAELHDRRAAPRDDYLSRVANAELAGRLMTDRELILFMSGFLVAGHETTTTGMTTLFFHLLRNPELQARALNDDKALGAAIEEAVRLQSPFHAFCRRTTEAVKVDETEIPASSVVRLCYAAANRDADQFSQPERFDIDRSNNQHLGFGFGRHVCAGAPLARLEMRIGFRTLLQRLPDVTLAERDVAWNLVGGVLATPRSLRVNYTPTGKAS